MAEQASIVLLHVFPSFAPGGQQARFAALAGALGPGFHHHVVALDGDFTANGLVGAGCNVDYHMIEATKSSFLSFSTIRAAGRLIRQVNTTVLCTYNWGAIEAALANRLGPRIPHIHFEDGFGPDETQDRQKAGRVLARRLILKDSIVVVPSRTLETLALSRWGLKREHVRRIANGIDLRRFETERTDRGARAVVVGAVGALRPEKTFTRLIRAFAKVDPKARARLKIAGEGPQRAAILDAAEIVGASDRLSLPGSTATPEDAYREFDIFALSSDTEQAPLSLMEAMAAGLPVAAPDVGDIAEMVAPQNRPFIVAAGDETALAGALNRLIAEPETRARIGAANAEKARASFGLQRMVEAHAALYRKAAERQA